MASTNDQLGVQIGFKFQSEKDVMPRVQEVLDAISENSNVEVHLGVNSAELQKILESTATLGKNDIKFDEDGASLKQISKINIGIGQTIKLIKDMKSGETTAVISTNFDKIQSEKEKQDLKDMKQLYQELHELQNKQYQMKDKLLKADAKENDILKQNLENDLKRYQEQELNLRSGLEDTDFKDSEYENKLIQEKIDLQEKYVRALSEATGLQNNKEKIEQEKVYLEMFKQIEKSEKEQSKLEKEKYNESISLVTQEYDIKTKLLKAEDSYKGVLQDQLTLNQKLQSVVIDDDMSLKILERKVTLQEEYAREVAKSNDSANNSARLEQEKMYLEMFKQIEQSEKEKSNLEKARYDESISLITQEYNIKTKLLKADGESKEILKEQLALNQKLQNVIIDDDMSLKTLEHKTKLNEDYRLSVSKLNDEQKKEKKEMQSLIVLEKQKYENKLKNYKIQYKGNEDVKSLTQISMLLTTLGSKSKDIAQLRKEFKELSLIFDKMVTDTKGEIGNINKSDDMSFMNNLKANFKSLSSYFLSGSLIYSIANTFKQASTYVIELDSAMTNLKKVTNETDGTYKDFLSTAHEISLEFGSQSNLVVDAVTMWAKTGKTLSESTELAKSTMLLTKVGDVDSVNSAQNYMIAPLTAFNLKANESINLIDKYNNVSNNMSATTEDMGEALSKSASTMATAGNTLDETIALLAVAESKTKQGGQAVGTA